MERVQIKNVDLKLNNITDKVIMGPQGEILELIERFNNQYNADISCTRTFRWSPGIYDKMRELLTRHFLGWNVRTNSMYTLFNKIESNNYYKRRLRESITQIDTKLYNKRSEGLVFQENKEEIKEYFLQFLNKLSEFADYKHDNVFIEVTVGDEDLEMFNHGNIRDIRISIVINIHPECLSVGVWDGDAQDSRHIANLYTPYVIKLQYNISFIKWFNAFCSAFQSERDIVNFNNMMGHGTGYSEGWIEANEARRWIQFPYISIHGRGQICLGDLQQALFGFMFNMNPIMFYDIVYQWATTFIVNKSHPYNNIALAFHGHPKDISDDDLIILGGSGDPNSCTYGSKIINMLREGFEPEGEELDLANPYCDITGCKLRDNCKVYTQTIKGDMKPKRVMELERNQRTSPWPSYMQEDENGVWRDTRTIQFNPEVIAREADMQVESEMVSNDGGEIEDRDGEGRNAEDIMDEYMRVHHQDMIEESPSTDESDNYEAPF